VCRKTHSQRRLAGGVIGTAVGAYAFLDDLFLGPVIAGLAVWLPWYLAFGLATSAMTVVNVSCCDWLQRRWESWLGGHGARLEARLSKMRRGRVLRHPLGWIARESPVWFVVAAGLIGTVIVVAVARLSGGAPIGRRQIVLASLAYSIGFAATYTGIGVGLADLLRAV
jgi:hypothetical protein